MPEEKVRHASCECGAVTLTARGEPGAVVACHCEDCQKRTGSPFAVGAYYDLEQVNVAGDTTSYTRPAQDGRSLTQHFCKVCGGNVYYYAEKHAGGVGVPVGMFTDLDFPPPARSVWEQSKHDWVTIPDVSHHPQSRES